MKDKEKMVPPSDEQREKAEQIKGLLGTNKTAAMGLAVLFATGTFLSGCGGADLQPENQSGSAQWEVYDDDFEDEDTYYYQGSHGGSYYRYSGRPVIRPGGGATWSKPAESYKSGGYGFFRGGSAGG